MYKIILPLFFVFITGCNGVGVVNTNNPQQKLEQADSLLYEQNRPLLAERLIFEAITEYRQTNNQFGLANALRDYGDLLGSSAVAQAGVQFLRAGFHDPDVTMQNNLDKSKYYFAQSIEHYNLAGIEVSRNGELSKLMNIYFNIGGLSARLGNQSKSCAFLDKASNAYNDAVLQNPHVKLPSPKQGYGSALDYIKSKQNSIGC